MLLVEAALACRLDGGFDAELLDVFGVVFGQDYGKEGHDIIHRNEGFLKSSALMMSSRGEWICWTRREIMPRLEGCMNRASRSPGKISPKRERRNEASVIVSGMRTLMASR